MAPPTSSGCKLGLKPFTKSNILFYYAPLQGVISYTALSVNVMNPSLIVRIFPKRDVTNILLFNTLLGTGLYIYSRPHLQKATNQEKVVYSGFGALVFSLGSVLLWAIGRSVLPRNLALCTLAGVGSGYVLIRIGSNYLNHIDSQIKP